MTKNLSASETDQNRFGPSPLNQIEVVVHTENEPYPSSLVENFDSYVITDGQPRDQAQEPGTKDDV